MPSRTRLLVHDPYAPRGGTSVLHDALARWGVAGGVDATARLAVPTTSRPEVVDVDVVVVDAPTAIAALGDLTWSGPVWASGVPASVRVLALATRLARRLVAAGLVLPDLVLHDGTAHGVWRAVPEADDDAAAAVAALVDAMPIALHATARDPGGSPAASGRGIWAAGAALGGWLDAVVDWRVRTAAPQPPASPPRARILPWTARWAAALADESDAVVPLRDDARELVAGLAGWRTSLHVQGDGLPELRLSAPDTSDGPWRVDFGVRTESGRHVPAAAVWGERAGDEEIDAPRLREVLLAGLARAARVFPPLGVALEQPEPVGLDLDVADAWSFVDRVAPVLEGQAIIGLPDDLRDGDLRIRLRLSDGTGAAAPDDVSDADGPPGEDGPIDWDGTATATWEVAVGERRVDDAELATLLGAGAPLVHHAGRWLRVDPEVAERVRRLGAPRPLPLAEAVGLVLGGSTAVAVESDETDAGPMRLPDVDVVADGIVSDVVDRITAAAGRPAVAAEPDGFVGTLRPYQRRGVAWLGGLRAAGLGGVLADDMGLGKTVQLIAHLLAVGRGPHLIVCPTSVVGNWERELHRFAPGLVTVRHHGPERAREPYDGDVVVVTSYGTLRRDVDVLAGTAWDVVTLDEAQVVKNPRTAGARAVRRLHAHQRVAMTGTPLENRLVELWSLLDATNPGLLGSRAAFGRRFVGPIEGRRDAHAARRLQRLVAPFLLRREKRDPAVAAELPDKIERTVPCPLTAEQASMYQAATERALADLERVDGMTRRGRVLALLTQLKQVCNHPAQTDPEPGRLSGRSGKLEAARAIVAEAVGGGAQVLVFTQFVRMAELLSRQLGGDLDTDVPVLHGGLSARAREEVVARFQGERDAAPPVLVVSLRAGGTGLNLTAASHVVHFDRWWNPAVEDQATDRAHRIGQRRTVEVHKLVTSGTVEERIDELLTAKRLLADQVVGAGEAWLTELGDAELAELVALAGDADLADFDDDDLEDSFAVAGIAG